MKPVRTSLLPGVAGALLVCVSACVGVVDETGLGTTSGGAASGGGGSGAGGAAGGSGAGAGDGLPCDVAALLSSRCVTCHGATPLPGVPTSLVSYADLTAPAKTDPSQTNAALAVMRMTSTTTPMPPAPAPGATAAEVAAMQSWIAAGYPQTGCGGTTGGVSDPFAVAPTCTSATTWRGGDGALMDPGMACNACHQTRGGEAPIFAIAGTLYPTAHEPDLCYGTNGAVTGAAVVITGADGKSVTLVPNSTGNFSYRGSLAVPFSAKVTYMGRERDMVAAQTSGDCNACHTQSGTMSAPGRILLP